MTYRKSYKSNTLLKRKKRKNSLKKFLQKKTSIDGKRRAILIVTIILLSILFFAFIYGLTYLQNISTALPSPDKPFGAKDTSTELYDRSGKLLYRVFDDEDRDPVDITQIPPLLIWSFLAAEDIKFYEHQGIDIEAIGRCTVRFVQTNAITCGGSTITQQLIRKTTLSDDISLERNLKEMILAMRIEKLRTKNEILEMYLTIVPGGSNIYGITRAADFYFDKSPQELTLAEMAILASIPQNPSVLSPTKSTNPGISMKLLTERKEYVLRQLESNSEYINSKYSELSNTSQIILTDKMIEEALQEEIRYSDPTFRINAPHFVFYVLDQLQKGPYKEGQPFTLEEIETQGYKIFTTLDLDMQNTAQLAVQNAVETYGKEYGAENAGLITINPKTGEILTMVGSYNYFGNATPENCTVGATCKFEPQVNVVDTLQAYGSTLKPLIYYQSFMDGTLTPETKILDAPVKIGNYIPKNYDGKFSGINTAREMLVNSRNIPAILLLDKIGVKNFIALMSEWGYTTMNNPNGYGLSLAVGGGEIKLLEHAQAYGVFANNGVLTQNVSISKIVDKSGQVIYSSQVQSETVADPRGIFLVNDILNATNSGPGYSFDGRDVSGKTGTSEDQKETLYIAYSPEFVVAGILVNNDNSTMKYGATGFTSVRPWVGEYLKEIGNSFPPTSFPIPLGLRFKEDGNIIINGISDERNDRFFSVNYQINKFFLQD